MFIMSLPWTRHLDMVVEKKKHRKTKNRHCPSPVGISKDYEIEKNSLEELNSTIHWL